MTRQIWAREHLVSYLAGGLSTEERYEIQELLKTDADLAMALADLEGLDERVRKLFVAAKPRLGFEDRVIRSLREKNVTAVRERRLKMPVKWILVAASLLVVVAAGLVAVDGVMSPSLRMHSVGQLLPTDRPEMVEAAHATKEVNAPMEGAEFDVDRIRDIGGFDDESKKQTLSFNQTLLADEPPGANTPLFKRKEAGVRMKLGDGTSLEYRRGGEAIDGLTPSGQLMPDPKTSTTWGLVPSESKLKAAAGGLGGGALGGALGGGGAPAAGRPPARGDTYQFFSDTYASTPGTLPKAGGGASDTRFGGRLNGPVPSPSAAATAEKLSEAKKEGAASGLAKEPQSVLARPESGRSSAPVTGVPVVPTITTPPPPADAGAFRPGDFFGREQATIRQSGKTVTGTSRFDPTLSLSPAFGAPSDKTLEGLVGDSNKGDKAEKGQKDTPDGERLEAFQDGKKPLDDQIKDLKKGGKDDSGKEDLKKAEEPPQQKSVDVKTPETKTAPVQRRVVIRSGDIEFEVDSFDQAVTTIYRLINLTKGGVVATTNSDKLANGKTRGSVVVRMPPEELDDFVLALRRELGKNGELKGQKIGSQDVTKHYTDMESELRGLRVSEERLIVMMKDTKAKLSDLLAVETQLANTRTKIERLEGELRYYSNLAAMSTLTINLNEKEIRVAAGVVESERIQAGVESEDVDKSFQEAKTAIDELKGRVFRSELKQSAAGQFNAILQFEIAPESAGLMRDRLKQIGTVARLEIDRVQKVEGGGSANRESKVKRGDTQFLVNIYNLANVTPRETVNARIVANDVPGTFRKLRELVVKLKGNLRNSSMVNSDANNVVALLDFDLRRVDEPQIQTALEGAGEFLNRSVQRSAESDNVTDTKVRFSLRLESVASVTARDTNSLSMAAIDVPESFRKVKEAILKVKGHIRNANLQETDKTNISATLDFDVARADEAAIQTMLAGIGEITTRVTQRRPDNESVTDAKVNFNVSMTSVAALTARETTTLEIATTNVPETFAKLRDAATKAKSQVRAARLEENDQQETVAELNFDVLRVDDEAVLAAIAAAGEQLSRKVDRQPSAQNLTDSKLAFNIRLVSTNSIPPRQGIGLKVQVDNVADKVKVLQAFVKDVQGRVIEGPKTEQKPNGEWTSHIVYIVPLASANAVAEEIKGLGKVIWQNEKKNPAAPDGKLARAQIEVLLVTQDQLVPRDEGFGSQLRNWLSISLRGLSATASILIAALLFIAPFALIGWVGYRISRRFARPQETSAPAAPQPTQP